MNRNRLAFEDQSKTLVKLDGKVVGHINQVKGGYQYFPKGSKTGGEVFKTKGECMYSLYDLGND